MLVKWRRQWRETRGTGEVGEWKSQEARADGRQEEETQSQPPGSSDIPLAPPSG